MNRGYTTQSFRALRACVRIVRQDRRSSCMACTCLECVLYTSWPQWCHPRCHTQASAAPQSRLGLSGLLLAVGLAEHPSDWDEALVELLVSPRRYRKLPVSHVACTSPLAAAEAGAVGEVPCVALSSSSGPGKSLRRIAAKSTLPK